MSGIKNNRRTQLTKKMIKDTFLQLLATQPLEKISVTEICQKADINRGTFYAHYTDPKSLYQEIQNDLFQEVQPLLRLAPAKDLSQWLENLLNILERNPEMTAFIISDTQQNTLLKRVFNEVYDLATTNFQSLFHEHDPEMLHYYFSYYSSGTIGTIADWLKNGRNISAHDLANLLSNVLQLDSLADKN